MKVSTFKKIVIIICVTYVLFCAYTLGSLFIKSTKAFKEKVEEQEKQIEEIMNYEEY